MNTEIKININNIINNLDNLKKKKIKVLKNFNKSELFLNNSNKLESEIVDNKSESEIVDNKSESEIVDNKSESNLPYIAKIMQSQLNREYKSRYSKYNDTYDNTNVGSSINLITCCDSIFNINNTTNVTNTIKHKKWKEFTNDEKIVFLNLFFEKQNKYPNDILEELINMILDNKINNKSEIHFDEINQRIIKIPLIKKKNNEYYIYILNNKKLSVKKNFIN